MITNPVLEEKNRVQEELSEMAGYDVKKYSELVHRLFLQVQEQYGLKFKYADRQGGFIRTGMPPAESMNPSIIQKDGQPWVLIPLVEYQQLLEAKEELEDIQDFDEALANPQMPHSWGTARAGVA
jgi:hypothetical protein